MADIVLAGNTSGTVTLSAPDVAGTSTLNLPASSGTVLDDASVGVCRAWVNFNGEGTVAIRASFNVSSITDNGTGVYTVNFTNAIIDVNYSVVGLCHSPGLVNGALQAPSTNSVNQAVGSIRVGCISLYPLAAFDASFVQVAIFR